MDFFRKLRQLRTKLAASMHLVIGKYRFSRNHLSRAAAHFQQHMALAGPSFEAHAYLGRIYLKLGRFDCARKEFARARFIDPNMSIDKDLPNDVLIEMAERYYRPTHFVRRSDNAAPLISVDYDRGRTRSIHDDFSSQAERDHFSVLPPISSEDIKGIDWEDLSRQLDE